MNSGVYMIINRKNGKRYIGSTGNFDGRWKIHLKSLQKGTHHSILLQRAFNKYGEENFVFMIKELVKDLTQLVVREQHWKDYYKSYDPEYGYDICRYANSRLGVKHNEEAKRKISEARKGKKNSEETNRKIGLSQKGKKNHMFGKHLTEDTKKKLSLANSGENAPFYGKHHSEEFKTRLSLMQKGKPKSEETRQRMCLAAKRRWAA